MVKCSKIRGKGNINAIDLKTKIIFEPHKTNKHTELFINRCPLFINFFYISWLYDSIKFYYYFCSRILQ